MTTASDRALSGPFFMFVSAALFGYFGFTVAFSYYGTNGQLLIYVPMLEWTLKISAVAFAVAGMTTLAAPFIGNLIYCITGVLGALMFAIIAIMDFADPQHQVMSPFLLVIFAAWNGFNSWAGLRELIAARRGSNAPKEPDLDI